jgi:hypothetical protein
MKQLEHTGDSANISWYAEQGQRGAYVYAEVLCDSIRRGPGGSMVPRPVPRFYVRVSLAGIGKVAEFTYRPRKQPGQIPLRESLVTQLVRSRFIPAEDNSADKRKTIMETEHSLVNLEQSCQQPGHWLIEGFSVKRVKPQLWRILNPPARITHRLYFWSLTEARHWIVDELNGAHDHDH